FIQPELYFDAHSIPRLSVERERGEEEDEHGPEREEGAERDLGATHRAAEEPDERPATAPADDAATGEATPPAEAHPEPRHEARARKTTTPGRLTSSGMKRWWRSTTLTRRSAAVNANAPSPRGVGPKATSAAIARSPVPISTSG